MYVMHVKEPLVFGNKKRIARFGATRAKFNRDLPNIGQCPYKFFNSRLIDTFITLVHIEGLKI